MQTGLKAGLAIVLAVFLTGAVGFLTAVTPEEEERTHYTQVSDLTPVIDYTAIDSYTEYNPISNVTGWTDNTGVTIPFKTSGISAYIYHHYISSESRDYTATVYQSGIMNRDWSGGIENATWYPLANVITQDEVGSVTDQRVVLERISAGHVNIGPDSYTSQARSFSVYFGLYTDDVLEHGFTLTFEKQGSVSDKLIEISSIAEFKSWSSSWWKLNTSSIFAVNVDVDIPLAANQKLYVAFMTADTISSSGIPGQWLNLYNGYITVGQGMSPIDPYIVYNGGLSYRSESSVSSYAEITNTIKINGVTVQDDDSDNAYAYMSFGQLFGSELSNLNDGTMVYMDGIDFYTGTRTFRSDMSGNYIVGETILDVNKVTGKGLVYVKDDQSWYKAVLSKNGRYYEPDRSQPAYTSDKVFVIMPGFYKSFTVSTTYPILEYKYIDSNQFVTIGNGITGYWGNFMDTVGGSVNSTPYQNGQVVLLTTPGTTIYSDTVFWKDADGQVTNGTMSLTVPSSIPYNMARVTLDFQAGNFYAQGIVWGAIDETDRGTGNWTLRPYEYPISPTLVKGGSSTTESPSYVNELQFSKPGGTKVFILSTYVQTDPMGRLWGDPSVYLGYYYPDYYEYDNGNTGRPITALRVLFNAFVSYGTSLTINGQHMPVSDGEITFTYYEYETEIDDSTTPATEYVETVIKSATMPVKGMAVDWEDGHVYLVFTEKGKTRYDLGEFNTTSVDVVVDGKDTGKDTVVTDVIYGTGTWYWQSNLYTISHETETVLHLDLSQGINGWGMSLQVSMLLFTAMLILGVGIVHYYYRESDEPMGIIDWIIIGLAILLSLGVAVL